MKVLVAATLVLFRWGGGHCNASPLPVGGGYGDASPRASATPCRHDTDAAPRRHRIVEPLRYRYPSRMPETRSDPSVLDLFAGFFVVGICGFGGVLPWARRMIVERRKWLTAAEFSEMLGLCQFLPGGNVMNLTIALGSRFRGVPGALACLLGLMAAPVAIVIGLGVVYDQYAALPPVRRAFVALSAAAAAYLLATALKIARPLAGRPLALAVAVCTFLAIAVLRLPLAAALPVLAVGSAVLLWRFRS